MGVAVGCRRRLEPWTAEADLCPSLVDGTQGIVRPPLRMRLRVRSPPCQGRVKGFRTIMIIMIITMMIINIITVNRIN